MKIILATNNQGKVAELKNAINKPVFSLKDLGFDLDVLEDGKTLEENAMKKAFKIASYFPNDIIIADDTGLFVESLDFAPGVYSARYAGPCCNSEQNIDKLLENMKDCSNRKAYFETVIVVYKDNDYQQFSGRLDGEILYKRYGDGGFGYDPIFYVDEFKCSLAQVTKEQKNQISHRGKAIKELISSNLL